ncbi:MAG: hypothetical protein RIF34_10645 [Candidatus Kapaibacterium sp.]
MLIFHDFDDAKFAAEEYFYYQYGLHNVDVHSAHLEEIVFYTTDDLRLKDRFSCIINDGLEYLCVRRGVLKVVNPEER